MLEPLVSIFLPVYSRKKYLAQAINSVLQQTYQTWELMIERNASILEFLDESDCAI